MAYVRSRFSLGFLHVRGLFLCDRVVTQMHNLNKWLCICILACALVTPAEAYFDTGNTLLAICEKSDDFSVGLCIGTILGHYEMMYEAGYDCGDDSKRTKLQIRDVIVKYLRENPAARHVRASALSFFAFVDAFNCKGLK
jgi:hypothetical protein